MTGFGSLGDRGGESKHIYRMHEKLISIGDDYWIEDEKGERAFYVDGKVLRVRNRHNGYQAGRWRCGCNS